MTKAQSRYIAREALIGAIINALISAAFAYAVFRGSPAQLWRSPSLLLDFLPQSFAVAAFSVLVPTPLTRQRVLAGAVQPLAAPALQLPNNVMVRAVLIGIVATAVPGGAAIALTAAFVRDAVPFAAVLTVKVAYGALLGALVTALALTQALADAPRLRG